MFRNISVMGIYPDRTTVSDAINVLIKAGYRRTDISVLSSDNEGSKDFAHEKKNKAWEYAAMGAAAGAVTGAVLTWFLSVHPVAINGLGSLAAAGPVISAVAGAGAVGTLGWITGMFLGMRMTQYVARRYAGRIRHGGILLSVHCDTPEWCSRALKLLRDTGARHISAAPEAAADFGTTDRPTERAPIMSAARVDPPPPPAPELVPEEIKK